MNHSIILGYFLLFLLGGYQTLCQSVDDNVNRDKPIEDAQNEHLSSPVSNEINEQLENLNTEQLENISEESHDDEHSVKDSVDSTSNENTDQLHEEQDENKVSEDQGPIELLIIENGKGDGIDVVGSSIEEENNIKDFVEISNPHFGKNQLQDELGKLQEQKNVPLREILRKLKPPGLLDEDDEQQTEDFTVTGTNVGDVEGEDSLSSSGLTGTVQDVTLGLTNISKLNSNVSITNTTADSVATTVTTKQAVCEKLELAEPITNVEILNATLLQKHLKNDPSIVGRSTVAKCHLIYFFSPYCDFSIAGSAYVNGLARSIPNIPIFGLDSIEHHSMNARYGVMGTPTLILFHNGNVVGRYNASEYSTSQLSAFVSHYTTEEVDFINITSADFEANLPSKLAVAPPYTLWIAWSFIFICTAWLFLTSELCARLTEAVLNNWREAEAQHAHED